MIVFLRNKVIPGRFQSHHVSLSRLALRPTQRPTDGVPAALPLGAQQPGREVDHSISSNVEVKINSHTSTSRIHLRIRITLLPIYAYIFKVVSFVQFSPQNSVNISLSPTLRPWRRVRTV